MEPNKFESIIIGALLGVIGIWIFFNADNSKQYIWSDAEGYYMYLPALTLYGFSDLPVRTTAQFSKMEATGRYYDKYTSGVAIMQMPFYFLACVYAGISGDYLVDGYSQPFQWSVLIAALFYSLGGLFILYKVLRKQYTLFIVIAALVSIYLGTNLMYYSVKEPGTAHVYAFFLWVCLIWQTPRIYLRPSWINFIILALIIGLLVFIRPSNAVGAILILLWDVKTIRERFHFIVKHILKYALLLFPFVLLTIMQLLLWQHMSGELIFFSYNQEPGFIYLLSPKILNVLFHVHNGLFIYAPVLLMGAIGLIFGIEKGKENFILIGSILAISTYIFASWWAWWFGGAYGHRCYVDLLPLLVFPLAYFYKQVSISNFKSLQVGVSLIAAFMIYYSVSMTLAYRSPWDGPNFGWKEFWTIVNESVI